MNISRLYIVLTMAALIIPGLNGMNIKSQAEVPTTAQQLAKTAAQIHIDTELKNRKEKISDVLKIYILPKELFSIIASYDSLSYEKDMSYFGEALANRDNDFFTRLLKADLNPNSDFHYFPLLTWASIKENADLFIKLLIHGGDFTRADQEATSYLWNFCKRSSSCNDPSSLTKFMINDPNRKISGHPLLIWATSAENLDLYEDLLRHGANINVHDGNGTHLLLNAMNCKDSSFLNQLLIRNANPNATLPDSKGIQRRLLWWALYKGRFAHFKRLLEAGASIDTMINDSYDQETNPWKLALDAYDTLLLKELIKGKNPNTIKITWVGEEFTLLEYANRYSEVCKAHKKVLIAAGAKESGCIIS